MTKSGRCAIAFASLKVRFLAEVPTQTNRRRDASVKMEKR